MVVESPPQALLSIKDVSKAFPGVKALDRVSLEVFGGAVHGIVGENGAGKSTLMKILSGVYAPTGGEMRFDGAPVAFFDPRGHHVLAFDVDDVDWVSALPDVVQAGRVRRLEIQRVNGVPVRSTPVAAALEHAGFVPTPRGVVLRG